MDGGRGGSFETRTHAHAREAVARELSCRATTAGQQDLLAADAAPIT